MTLTNTLEQAIWKKHKTHRKPTPSINFMREGERPTTARTTRINLLQKAQVWDMKVDLGGRLHFPQVIQTALRPDVVLWSKELKNIIMIKLTDPWEEGCDQAF
ncbi:hypothetical protein N1851_017034 [Merluccius polli]|uniref:Uncharacterized protein n=1 Tax=Merluccius polli TaxID=89951 RepID=A0AA47MR15_MERPO|nr:hypothetical protein N1851_017034 [Merluccius polli]